MSVNEIRVACNFWQINNILKRKAWGVSVSRLLAG